MRRSRASIPTPPASSTSFAAALVLAAPTTPGAAAELNEITTRLQSTYGKGRATHKGKTITGDDAEALMGDLRNPAELKEIWQSWHENVGRPMRQDYTRMVEIANQGAKELGYADTGAMWRSNYDMSPEEFSAMYDRLWAETKPLYDQLHCYTRTKLNQKYGNAVQPASGPIRADLLGNMWAQEWGNIYDVVAPKGAGDIGYDLTDLLGRRRSIRPRWSGSGERFYTSLGMAPLPQTFWSRSQIVRPQGREVICHASAWDLDNKDDLRIKMCTKVNADDFVTIHHELGHNFYQRAYNQQPYLYLNGANDGFHEAIGDFIALVGDAGISGADRPARPQQGAGREQGYGPAASPGDGQGRLPSVRPAGRQVALGRVRRLDHAGQLQPGMGRAEAAVSGHHAAGCSGRSRTSTRAPSSISRGTRPTRATSSPGSCSSSSTRRPATCRAGRARFTAAASTATRKSGSG